MRLVRAHLEGRRQSLHEGFKAAASTSTAPARRCWRSSPGPASAPAPKAVAYAKGKAAQDRHLDRHLRVAMGRLVPCRLHLGAQAEQPFNFLPAVVSTRQFMQQAIIPGALADRGNNFGGHYAIEQATVLFDPTRARPAPCCAQEDAMSRCFPDPDRAGDCCAWIDAVRQTELLPRDGRAFVRIAMPVHDATTLA